MPRDDERADDQIRALRFETGFIGTADGSCLVELGGTRVICTASIEDGVPAWLKGRGRGWLTAEYDMLPAATGRRRPRDARRGRTDGRTVEIQRLVGRALRPSVDMEGLGERTVHLDCDVIEADGGTRTAAITGAWAALHEALRRHSALTTGLLVREVAAVSVGVVGGRVLLDLAYAEDSKAEADLNIVMDSEGSFLEVQGTGEGRPFTRNELDQALDLAAGGVETIVGVRRAALALEDGRP